MNQTCAHMFAFETFFLEQTLPNSFVKQGCRIPTTQWSYIVSRIRITRQVQGEYARDHLSARLSLFWLSFV